ncbi:MAG TPA: ABC transporter permease, partial [Pseudomonadales bacterium]|nr:ABC transporter permease [Pseudomonadales bacterium]
MSDESQLPSGLLNSVRALGAWFINTLWKLGFASRFLAAVVLQSGQLFLRPQLLIREIFFAGVLSLIIIVVSGLFVGMVLGLQGYNTLVRFGSADA